MRMREADSLPDLVELCNKRRICATVTYSNLCASASSRVAVSQSVSSCTFSCFMYSDRSALSILSDKSRSVEVRQPVAQS